MNNVIDYIVCILMLLCIVIALIISVSNDNKKTIPQISAKSDLHNNVLQAQNNLTSSNVHEAGNAFMQLITYGVIALCSIVNNSGKYNVKKDKKVFKEILKNNQLRLLAQHLSKISYKG